jgi:hypothetical protein
VSAAASLPIGRRFAPRRTPPVLPPLANSHTHPLQARFHFRKSAPARGTKLITRADLHEGAERPGVHLSALSVLWIGGLLFVCVMADPANIVPSESVDFSPGAVVARS